MFSAGGGFGGPSGVDWQSAPLSGFNAGGGGHEWAAAAQGHDQDQGQGYIGGDFHHGVSIVGTGGGGKGAVFDLTNQGKHTFLLSPFLVALIIHLPNSCKYFLAGPGHQGAFGGSFVASSKYSAAGHGGGNGGGRGHDWSGGYGVNEGTGFAENYSEVLRASESIGSSGGYESLGSGGGLGGYH